MVFLSLCSSVFLCFFVPVFLCLFLCLCFSLSLLLPAIVFSFSAAVTLLEFTLSIRRQLQMFIRASAYPATPDRTRRVHYADTPLQRRRFPPILRSTVPLGPPVGLPA